MPINTDIFFHVYFHLFVGPDGLFWCRCFYPTNDALKQKSTATNTEEYPTDSKMTAFIGISTITMMISFGTIVYYKEEKDNMLPSLLLLTAFAVVHICRIAYDIQHQRFASAYISPTEVTHVLNGMASFASLPGFIFSHMSQMRINCCEDAPVFLTNDSTSGNEKMKVAFVIHGLGGSRSFYSFICMRLAAEGFFVICPEFGDGTACLSIFPDGYKRKYRKYALKAGEVEMSQGNLLFRQDQLEHRCVEMGIIVDYFLGLNKQQIGQKGRGKSSKTITPIVSSVITWNKTSKKSSFFVDSLSVNSASGDSYGSVGSDMPKVVLDIERPVLVVSFKLYCQKYICYCLIFILIINIAIS